MRLFIAEDGAVVTEHNGAEVKWNATIFDRTDFRNIPHLFREINGYWAHLPADRQYRIWLGYKAISEQFETTSERTRLAMNIAGLLDQMYADMPMEELDRWIGFHGAVKFPPDGSLLLEHDPYDPNPGRTYLKRDYNGLVTITAALRPMIPIWGEYMRRVKDEVGSEYKEYIAIRLLRNTHVMRSEPIERLRRYVDATLSVSANQSNAYIISGLGSEETIEWLLAMVCIRRIAVGDIDASDTRGNIITNVFGFISNTLRDFDKRFGGGVRDKNPDKDTGEDEGSILESFKVKQEVSPGDIILYNVYAEDPKAMAIKIDPTIDLKLLDLALSRVDRLQNASLSKHHITLCQWVLHRVLPPLAIPLLLKPGLLRSLAVTQALIWHWGIYDIAALVTATRHFADDEIVPFDSKVRITPSTLEQLLALFPHLMPADKNQTSEKKSNYAIAAISLLIRELSGCMWQYHAPPELLKHCTGVDGDRRAALQPSTPEQIGLLIIATHQKRNTPHPSI